MHTHKYTPWVDVGFFEGGSKIKQVRIYVASESLKLGSGGHSAPETIGCLGFKVSKSKV